MSTGRVLSPLLMGLLFLCLMRAGLGGVVSGEVEDDRCGGLGVEAVISIWICPGAEDVLAGAQGIDVDAGCGRSTVDFGFDDVSFVASRVSSS
jgi:hypothetical protein